MSSPFMLLLLIAIIPLAIALRNTDRDKSFAGFKDSDTIKRDVAIIGGGSSGTHAAISLKDNGFTSIVVEKKKRLGGHTKTYVDPSSGTPVDYGVVIFHNEERVRSYFARFGIGLTQNISTLHSRTFDFKTGKAVSDNLFTPEQVAAALQKYSEIISQWPNLDRGLFLPKPIPADLTMSLGSFANKYGLEALIPMFSQLNPGLGDLLSVPMVENLRVGGLSLLRSLSVGFLTTETHANSQLYEKAEAELIADQSVLLGSEVILARRRDEGVKLIVATPDGKKLILAKRLLVTIPPHQSMTEGLDLSRREAAVFSKFINAGYFTSIVNNTGIPGNLSVFNGDPTMPFDVPQLPGIYSIQETLVQGLHTVYYGTPRSHTPYDDASVKGAIIRDILKLQSSNPQNFAQTEPSFVAYSSHAPFYLQASATDIAGGFYERLYALQGERSTYWTGASWRAQDSSSLWYFNEKIVLPQLTSGL